MADVEYEVVEVDLTARQAREVAQIPGLIHMQPVDLMANMVVFQNPNMTSKQRERDAEKEKERMWQAFLAWQGKTGVTYEEGCVKTWIEQQVFNDCVQRGDWCPRCKKWGRGTVGCGTEGCKVGEYMVEYHICNIPRCTHYLHDKQESDPDGTRRCFEHHLR